MNRIELWKNVKNFQELQECMVKFLEGKYRSTPWHLGQVDPETIGILQKLRKINKGGFVSIQGQPGNHSKDDDLTENYQRGFIEGFIPKKYYLRFIRELLKGGKVVIGMTRLDSEKLSPRMYGDYESLLEMSKNGECRINLTKEIFPNIDHPFLKEYLDVEERDDLYEEKDGDVVRYYTNFWLNRRRDMSGDLKPKFIRYLERNMYGLIIIRKEYGKKDLEDIVLESLKKLI